MQLRTLYMYWNIMIYTLGGVTKSKMDLKTSFMMTEVLVCSTLPNTHTDN